MSFVAELKRRNVVRMAIAYAVVGWLIMEVASVVLPTFDAPAWTQKVITLLILLGFPMALVVAWAFEMTPEGLKRDHQVDRSESIARLSGRKLDFLIIGLLAVAVVFLLIDDYLLSEESETPIAAEPAAPDAEQNSIAVLPFVNISANPDNEYFSDGISEELLNLLSKLPELKVSSRTSSFAFKGKTIDIPTVAGQLGVKNVLEGSVRRAGNRVRITAQLIDAESDSHLWSETYDRELEDIFEVPDDIARHIVAALKLTLSPLHADKLESSRSTSIDAYDYYLRGRAYYLRSTLDGLIRAQGMFRKAIGSDPDYAPAYAGLAITYSSLFRQHDSDPSHLAEADSLSRKAVELAPDLDQAHVARAFALTVNQQYSASEQEFETALRLNPRLVYAHYYYGTATFMQGNYAKTVGHYRHGDRHAGKILRGRAR